MQTGADIAAQDKQHVSTLHFAAAHGHVDVVSYLWSKGAELDWETSGEFADLACLHGSHLQRRYSSYASARLATLRSQNTHFLQTASLRCIWLPSRGTAMWYSFCSASRLGLTLRMHKTTPHCILQPGADAHVHCLNVKLYFLHNEASAPTINHQLPAMITSMTHVQVLAAHFAYALCIRVELCLALSGERAHRQCLSC